jgi:hypothetical protein
MSAPARPDRSFWNMIANVSRALAEALRTHRDETISADEQFQITRAAAELDRLEAFANVASISSIRRTRAALMRANGKKP